MTLGLLAVYEIEALALNLTINESTGKGSAGMRCQYRVNHKMQMSSQKLLSLLVTLRLAVLLAMLLVGLSGLVGSGSSNQLVGELSLVGSVDNLMGKPVLVVRWHYVAGTSKHTC